MNEYVFRFFSWLIGVVFGMYLTGSLIVFREHKGANTTNDRIAWSIVMGILIVASCVAMTAHRP